MVARASVRWRLVVAAFIAACVAIFAASFALTDGWTALTPNACIAAERCFCEAAHAGPVAQPANALSNVGFFVAALAIAARLDRRCDRRLDGRSSVDARDVSFALLVAFLGAGSIALHATLTKVGGRVDVGSMIGFTSFLVADAFVMGPTRPDRATRVALAAFVLVAAASLALYAIVPAIGNGIFGALALVFSASEVARRRTRFLAAAGACFVVAFALWLPSQTHGPICEPSSVLQGHAAWHLLCAASTYCLFRHREARLVDA